MTRFAVVLVALAAFLIEAQGEDIVFATRSLINVDPVEAGAVKGVPKVIDSNLPTALNNIALTYSQNVMDNAANLVAASQQLKARIQSYDQTQKWNVAIEPAAYYVTSYYFAHYLVNNYNVFLYTVNCGK